MEPDDAALSRSGRIRRRLELQTMVLQVGVAAFFLAGAASGLFGATGPWLGPSLWFIAGYHLVYVWYALRWQVRGRVIGWAERYKPVPDLACITLAWLSLDDPYSPLWTLYLYSLVGYSRRFHGRAFAALTVLAAANLLGGSVYMSQLRSGAFLDSYALTAVAMVVFMALLASAIGDAWRDAELRARALAATDPLTGIANRRTFLAGLERLTQKPESSFSVLMLDLDNFKQLNDQHGHLFGDRVLAKAASVLQSHLRPGDHVARYGGEEFVVLLPGAGLEEAARIGERLREAVREATPTSVSIGCATRLDGESAEELIRRADHLLLEAKRSGKDQVVTEVPPLAA